MGDPPLPTNQSPSDLSGSNKSSLKRKRNSEWGQAPKLPQNVGNAYDSQTTSPIHGTRIETSNMASSFVERGVKTHPVSGGGRDTETTYRKRDDDRSPRSTTFGDRHTEDTRRRDRRSRSPSRNEPFNTHGKVSDLVLRDRDRELYSQKEAYKIFREAKADGEPCSPRIERRAGSGSVDSKGRPESRQSQDLRPPPNTDSRNDRPALEIITSKSAALPILEQKTRDTTSDPRSKLREALTHFLGEASEQASLQLRKDAAKKVLDRRVAEYEKSSKIHETFPAAAEALGAAKRRAQREFNELDEELIRKRQGSTVLIELVTDCLFSQNTATSTPVVTLTPVQTELSAIKEVVAGCVDQISSLSAEIQTLKNSSEPLELKTELHLLSSRVESIPDSRIELGKEVERINGVLSAQASSIEQLQKANLTGDLELDGVKSAVTSLAKGVNETKTTTEAKLGHIGARLNNLEKAPSPVQQIEGVDVMKKIQDIQRVLRDEFKTTQDVGDELLDEYLRRVDNRIKVLEDSNLEDRIKLIEGTERGQSTAEQAIVTKWIEPLERAYKAFSTAARHELDRMSGDNQRLTEDVKQISSARSTSVPAEVRHELSRISGDVQTLRDDIRGLNASAASLTMLTTRIQHSEERIGLLINDVEGSKVNINNLDFRMCNLSTADLARQILDHLDAHRRSADVNMTAISLRVQAFNDYIKRNEGERQAELAKVTENLRQELTETCKNGVQLMAEAAMQKFREAVDKVVAESSVGLTAMQREMEMSKRSLGSLEEDVDSTKTALSEIRDHVSTEIANFKTVLTRTQSAQLQMQETGRLANGHGVSNKKRKVSREIDSPGDSETDYRSAAS